VKFDKRKELETKPKSKATTNEPLTKGKTPQSVTKQMAKKRSKATISSVFLTSTIFQLQSALSIKTPSTPPYSYL